MDIKKSLSKFKRGKTVETILKVLFIICSKLPLREKTIVFESFSGKQYSDNPKAIYLYIKKNYPEYKLYWSFNRKYQKQFKEELDIIHRFSFKWIVIMASAKYWISNSRLPLWIPKRKQTTYVQTWHGTPLKKLGVDINTVHMPGTDTEQYKENFTLEASKWDYLISPNAYSSKIFKRAFNFNKKIIESGYPRNDILYTKNNEYEIEKINLKLGIPKDKKTILYAPTWRDDNYYSIGKYKFDLQLDLGKLKEEFHNDFVILLRMHYLVAENLDISEYGGFVKDVSSYSDINELYLISDVLITDYSSVFFDYANLRKPILFFTYDMNLYRDKLRGFYFDIERHAPGPLLTSNNEIAEYLRLIIDGKYVLPKSFEEFYSKFCYLEDGHASERVVSEVFLDK